MTKSVYSIILELAATRSGNDKKAILQREVANEDLKTFFRLALSNQIRFYQKKPISSITRNAAIELADAMQRLYDNIASRGITGNSARDYIEDLMNWVSEEDEEVLKLILQKKSGCDIGASIVNKIWPKLIPDFPCLLATNYDEKLARKLFDSSDWVYSQCLSGNWELEDSLGNHYKISEIVENRLNLTIKSFDEKTNSIVYNDIVDWFDNGETDDWYTITYKENGLIKTTLPLTKKHKLFVNGNWKTVEELRLGDIF